MKKHSFSVSGRESEAFNWALGLFGIATVMGVVDSWISDAAGNPDAVVNAFKEVQQSNPVQIAEKVIAVGASLTMWEVLRRKLVQDDRFWVSIAVVVMMVLSLLALVVGLPLKEAVEVLPAGGVRETAFGIFQARMLNVAGSFITIAQVVLSGLLAFKYAGRIRSYAASLLGAPILSAVVSFGVYWLYTSAPGLTFAEIGTYVNFGNIIRCALALLPMVLLRLALKQED